MIPMSDKYERQQLAAEALRDELIEDCLKNSPEFTWRWRIIKSANRKIPGLLRSSDPKEVKKGKSLRRRISHLEEWCEEYLEVDAEEAADRASLDRDPYAYYGVRRSDFG
jgi:hypothetical protein